MIKTYVAKDIECLKQGISAVSGLHERKADRRVGFAGL